MTHLAIPPLSLPVRTLASTTSSEEDHHYYFSYQVKVSPEIGSHEVAISTRLYKSIIGDVGEHYLNDRQVRRGFVYSECVHISTGVHLLDTNEGEELVIIGKKMLKVLNLKHGDICTITNKLRLKDLIIHEAGKKENLFGRDWKNHAYYADGIYFGMGDELGVDDRIIYMGALQVSYLRLTTALAPLCGDKFFEAKQKYPNLIGMVKIFHKGVSVIAHVLSESVDYSTVKFSKGLADAFQDLKLGDPLVICSDLDVDSVEEARMTKGPRYDFSPYQAIQLFKSMEPSQLKKLLWNSELSFSTSQYIFQGDLGHFLVNLTNEVPQLLSEPELCLKVFGFLDSLDNPGRLLKSRELQALMNAFKAHEHLLVERQHEYFDLIELATKQAEQNHTPLIIQALIQANISLESRDGENFIHLLYKYGGRLEILTMPLDEESPLITHLLYNPNTKGLTPFYYVVNRCEIFEWVILKEITKTRRADPEHQRIFTYAYEKYSLAENKQEVVCLIALLEKMREYF